MKLRQNKGFIWFIMCLPFSIVYFQRLAIGTVKDELLHDMGISLSFFANISTAYFYTYLLMQIPAGFLVEIIGARITVTVGTLLAGFGSIFFGMTTNPWFAVGSRLITGIGLAVIYIAILKMIGRWFKENEFATLSGFTELFGNLGALLAQTPLLLIIAVLSWRTTFIAVGFVSIAFSILCWIFVSDKPPIIEEHGKDGSVKQNGISRPYNFPEVFKVFLTVAKNPYTWPPILINLTFYGSFFALSGTWGQAFLSVVFHLSREQASNMLFISVLGYALASAALGIISDKLGKRKLPIMSMGILNLLCWIVLVLLKGDSSIYVIGTLMGVLGISAACFTLCWTLGKEVNHREFEGLSTSFVNAGGYFGPISLSIFIGYLLDKHSGVAPVALDYRKAFLVCVLFAFFGVISSIFIKETACKNIHEA